MLKNEYFDGRADEHLPSMSDVCEYNLKKEFKDASDELAEEFSSEKRMEILNADDHSALDVELVDFCYCFGPPVERMAGAYSTQDFPKFLMNLPFFRIMTPNVSAGGNSKFLH